MSYSQFEGHDFSAPLSSLLPWYAIRTKANQEKAASLILDHKGFESYLPLYRTRRRWSDRTVEAELPLFPGYFFCHFDITKRLPIMTVPGVVSVLGFGKEPAPIPESEIEAVQTILRSGLVAEPGPFLYEGQRIRINRGSLEGLEGILLKKKSEWRMSVSVSMLQRSVSVEIDREWISTI